MGDCNTCPLYLAAEKFCATSTPRRRASSEDAFTTVGHLIAAGARAKGLTVREVSLKIGRELPAARLPGCARAQRADGVRGGDAARDRDRAVRGLPGRGRAAAGAGAGAAVAVPDAGGR